MKYTTAPLNDPAALTFLDAVDVTLNSNTFFFRVWPEKGGSNHADTLQHFVGSAAFDECMYRCDLLRGWTNYQIIDWASSDQPRIERIKGSFTKPGVSLSLSGLPPDEFVERLIWMLTTQHQSPYSNSMPEKHALKIIGRLLSCLFVPPPATKAESLLSALSASFDHRASLARLVPPTTAVYAIQPDFLLSTGYFDPDVEEPPPLAYFDGGEADTCTAIFYRDHFALLLTNGSP